MRQSQMRKTLLGLLTGGVLIASGSASGLILPSPAAPACLPDGATTITLATFVGFGTGGCSVGDKNYTFTSTSFTITTPALTTRLRRAIFTNGVRRRTDFRIWPPGAAMAPSSQENKASCRKWCFPLPARGTFFLC